MLFVVLVLLAVRAHVTCAWFFGGGMLSNSLNMVLDGDELLEVPYIGERLKKRSAAAPSARGMREVHTLCYVYSFPFPSPNVWA